MKDTPLVSIIVPSFNVEQYVKKCLDSIKAQTYENWECIIVDRPSTKDNTTRVIKNYIKGDDRFRFIKQVNKGVSDGRNVGFKAAHGKYIQFTDPDDWLSPKMLELAVKRAETTNAEIVQFAWSNYYIQSETYINTAFMPYARLLPEVFSVKDVGNEIFNYGEFYVNSMSKLWRRDFLVNVKMHYPTELKRAEDLAEVSRVLMNASRITYLDEILYFYKADEYLGDTLSNFAERDDHNLDFYKAIGIVHKNMENLNLLPEFESGFCQMAIINSVYALNMSRFNLTANREIYECISSKILPMISSELKKSNPALHDTLTNCNHSQYIEKQMRELYFENKHSLGLIERLEAQNKHLNEELELSQIELKSHFSIIRSAKLTLGNVKRRILRPSK